jgi:hypothetical protein
VDTVTKSIEVPKKRQKNNATAMSRRDFLKLGAMAAVPLLLPDLPTRMLPELTQAEIETSSPPAPLGRIATWWRQTVREEPAPNGEWVAWKTRDDVIPLYASVVGEAPWPTNPVWYQTEGGYIHSGYVQPVADLVQPAITEIAEPGFWAQVSQPWAEARWSPTSQWTAKKLYYGTVYRVIGSVSDEAGDIWYQLKEGIMPWRPGPYVPAVAMRRISPEELVPISPGRPDKQILIDRQAQTLSCLEGSNEVFKTRISTGHHSTPTPRGEFHVLYKRHARRMTVLDIEDPYDLPGVPFTVYFTWSGVAIHGTYWHNDYGRVHSHGCVNLLPADAKWVFRWAEPVTPYEEYTKKAEPPETGTPVIVV